VLRRAADPFIYNIDGTVVAHGANPSNIGRTLPNIIADSIVLGGVVDGAALNTQFVEAAFNGGGWVGYTWRNGVNEEPYTKIAFITGVRRFGRTYYIGVGFNHQKEPARRGPHCAQVNPVTRPCPATRPYLAARG